MAGSEPVGLTEALDVIRDLLQEQLRLTGRLPKTVVVVGGTALAAQRIRDRSDDVDIYMPEIEDAAVLSVQEVYRRKYGEAFKIDATPVNVLWGDIAVNDIGDSPVVATLVVGSDRVEIRALAPETLYLLKVAAYREKDIPDLPIIANKCTQDSLVARAIQIFPWFADRNAFPQFVERLGRCIARDFGVNTDALHVKFGLSEAVLGKVREIAARLEGQFRAVARAAMKRRPDLIHPESSCEIRMVFDAKTAGVPKDVIGYLANHRDEASRIATEVQKTADPKRYMAWLAKNVVHAAKARGFDIPDNADEKLAIYADESTLLAMANEVGRATSFQDLLDMHSVTIPSDDHS